MSTLSLGPPNSIHRRAKRLAEEEGGSVNQLISLAVAEKLSATFVFGRPERGVP